MTLQNAIKARICRFEMEPNYPLGDLISWAEQAGVGGPEMLRHLDQVQNQLDTEVGALRRHGGAAPEVLVQHEYWAFYCAQVRAHYQTILRHPECKAQLALVQSVSTS